LPHSDVKYVLYSCLLLIYFIKLCAMLWYKIFELRRYDGPSVRCFPDSLVCAQILKWQCSWLCLQMPSKFQISYRCVNKS
jgi:hypothetical protein